MHKDAMSLPGLAETILHSTQLKGIKEYQTQTVITNHTFEISNAEIGRKISNYKQQDIQKNRGIEHNVSIVEVRQLEKRKVLVLLLLATNKYKYLELGQNQLF